jgi:hypothetical protein
MPWMLHIKYVYVTDFNTSLNKSVQTPILANIQNKALNQVIYESVSTQEWEVDNTEIWH